jgi:hypothetical protein
LLVSFSAPQSGPSNTPCIFNGLWLITGKRDSIFLPLDLERSPGGSGRSSILSSSELELTVHHPIVDVVNQVTVATALSLLSPADLDPFIVHHLDYRLTLGHRQSFRGASNARHSSMTWLRFRISRFGP